MSGQGDVETRSCDPANSGVVVTRSGGEPSGHRPYVLGPMARGPWVTSLACGPLPDMARSTVQLPAAAPRPRVVGGPMAPPRYHQHRTVPRVPPVPWVHQGTIAGASGAGMHACRHRGAGMRAVGLSPPGPPRASREGRPSGPSRPDSHVHPRPGYRAVDGIQGGCLDSARVQQPQGRPSAVPSWVPGSGS